MLRAGNVINDEAATDIFFPLNAIISLAVIASVLYYAIRYAGNPTINPKAKKIIQKTRKVILFFTLTRIVRGIVNMLRAHNSLGIRVEDSTESLGKALLYACVLGLMIFFTETWPIQVALEDDFISLFSKTKKKDKKPRDSISSINEAMMDAPIEQSKDDTKSDMRASKPKRKSLLQYTEENTSLADIMGRIKENLINIKNISQQTLFSNKEKNLGIIYKSELELKGTKQQVAVRLIEFSKIPKYLLENLYLEMAYYKENKFPLLVPILGLAYEPSKLYILTLWYKTSLHQYVYAEPRTLQENINAIK
jgi:hypothetical protein